MEMDLPSNSPQDSPSSATAVLVNPLLVPVIVGHLPPSSALCLRLVNKMWNEAAIPVLQKHAPYINLSTYSTEPEAERLERFLQFVDCVQSSPDFPFTKLSIELTPRINGSAWNVLIRSVASFLTHLQVKGPTGDDLDLDPTLPDDIHLPQLKHLQINLNPDEDAIVLEEPKFLRKIIAASPNLRSLALGNVSGRVSRQLIRHPDLQLETLKLHFDYVYPDRFEDLANFLISQRDNLVHLLVSAPNVRSFVEVATIKYSLPKVKTLHLEDHSPDDDDDDDQDEQCSVLPDDGELFPRFRCLEYGNKFPNLEIVDLNRVNGRNYKDFFAVNMSTPATSVTCLRLGPLAEMECQRAMVKYVPEFFPNLTSLEIPARFRTAGKLVAKLEHLETLTLDCGPAVMIEATVDTMLLKGLELEDEWHRFGQLSLQPSFGVVKGFRNKMEQPPNSVWNKIRILNVDFRHNKERYPISEDTCQLVLLQMRKLKEVHIRGRQPYEGEISAAVMKEMEAKFAMFFRMDD